jgi:N-acetylmuramoyl-L-alanine amidase
MIVATLFCIVSNPTNLTTTLTTPTHPITIVIDAGHGGRDGGVVGRTTKCKEADINLAISQQLQSDLQAHNYNIVMTRNDENGLYGDAKSNRKMADMRERERIIEQAQPQLVISIHQNSYPNNTERGAQVFYGINKTNNLAQNIANSIQTSLNGELPAKDRTPKKGDYYILNSSPYPSILIECGFLTTPDEETKLLTPEYQKQITTAIVKGVDNYFTKVNNLTKTT